MGFVRQIKRFGLIRNKPTAGTFGQQLVIRQFLKIVAVVIHELIVLTPKIAHPQREMICTILRQFFQNFETICNPSLYGVIVSWESMCHYVGTGFIRSVRYFAECIPTGHTVNAFPTKLI